MKMTTEEKIDPRLNDEDFVIPEGIPRPQLWRMLVAPVQPKKKSAGGIIIVDETQDAEEVLAFIGKVLAVGPLVGKKPEWPEGCYDVKVGDWVVFGRHAGQRFKFKGVNLLMIDDDSVIGKCDGPEGFRIYL